MYRFRNATGSRRKFKQRCCWRKKIAYTIFVKKGYFREKLDPFGINLQSLGDFMTQESRIRAIFFSSGAAVQDSLRKYFIPRHWSDKPLGTSSNHLEPVSTTWNQWRGTIKLRLKKQRRSCQFQEAFRLHSGSILRNIHHTTNQRKNRHRC